MSERTISLSETPISLADEQNRRQLRGLLLAGASSAPTKAIDKAYFDGLRARAKRRRAE